MILFAHCRVDVEGFHLLDLTTFYFSNIIVYKLVTIFIFYNILFIDKIIRIIRIVAITFRNTCEQDKYQKVAKIPIYFVIMSKLMSIKTNYEQFKHCKKKFVTSLVN